jgi:hypothetical protein
MRRLIEAEIDGLRNRLAASMRRRDAELRGKRPEDDDEADAA